MNEVYELLISEKERIERELEFERNQFDFEYRKNFDQDLCSRRGYIDISETSLNKKDIIIKCANNVKIMEAKKYVLDHIIKKYGYRYFYHSELLESEEIKNTHSNTKITCDRLYQDSNGRYTEGMIFIGGFVFDSPLEMSFEEYMNIYYSAIESIITCYLKKNNERISVEKALEQACGRIIEEEIILKRI